MEMKDVILVDYVRSAFTPARRGALAGVRPDEMAAQVVRALLARNAIPPADIEDVIVGCSTPEAEQGYNVARNIGFLAGVPICAAATTVNRFCGSSMQSIHMAAGAIQMGAGHVFVCAGVESMSRVPATGYNFMPHPGLAGSFPAAYIAMGQTAENLARRNGISRDMQDEFAVGSHAKAEAAARNGLFKNEIVPIQVDDLEVDRDGCIRPGTTREALANLKPAFDQEGTVTAGTSSPLTDGAAAVLVCSEEYVRAHGLSGIARVKSIAVAGCAPDVMGIGPVPATEKALQRAGLELSDIDIIELNEAFAAQAIAVMQDAGMDASRINPDGGAIALGHPLGATGARITGKLATLLRREGREFGLATQCIGGGQGIATILQAV
jgi:acetyl-CoA acyltransferase